MSKKTYLSQQIRLMSLATYDLFTAEEYAAYGHVISSINQVDRLTNEKQEQDEETSAEVKRLIEERKVYQQQLAQLIQAHAGTPRRVRLENVLDTKKFRDENGELHLPRGVSWNALKMSKRIAEFASEESRAMGLQHLDVTFDKVIVKWKSLDVLEQLVKDGFILPVENPDGTITEKHFHVETASAGQLRTDKVQCLSDEIWEKIRNRMECGITEEKLNEKGGINVNKLMAYKALPCSATDEWPDASIDECIVIRDFEAPVSGMMKYIKPDYSSEVGVQTVKINHCDGVGMMLPSVSRSNFMVRAPWIKGLLTSFNFIRFCEVVGAPPVITDYWGQEHNLVEEGIRIIFTESQFKLAKYYSNWNEYKQFFKDCGCKLCRTNYEEDYIEDTYINYQMLQTLTDFTDEEIKKFTEPTYQKIVSIGKDKDSMLRVLRAEETSEEPYRKALSDYPELLREAYTRETLKSIKRKWVMDAKSGRIKCRNKRLFVIPDMYAACEFWFQGIKEPKGLLEDGEVACRVYQRYDKADVLRSPHLYLEHSIRTISHDPKIYEWFYTNGIYTSCHDLISRILQFDCDGDQLNVVVDPVIVSVAERNIEKFNIIPLFYDANKAAAEQVNRDTIFNGLKRAHEFSGIGQVSNSLTKLWNRNKPDMEAAAWLCKFNNETIDAAKTGKINSYENYPEVNARINKATGGIRGNMPHFFQYSKNGRKSLYVRNAKKKKYAKLNKSTMNRICQRFDDIGQINMNVAGIPPFNWQMLMGEEKTFLPQEITSKAITTFCDMDSSNLSNVIEAKEYDDLGNKSDSLGYDLIKEAIVDEMISLCGSLQAIYPYVTKYLFTGENFHKPSHKQMFWRVFGEIALKNLEHNLEDYTVCSECGAKIPSKYSSHLCLRNSQGYFECVDCGLICERINSRQCRCEDCQKEHYKLMRREQNNRSYARKLQKNSKEKDDKNE